MGRRGLIGFAKFGFVVSILSIVIFLSASYISYVTADPNSIVLNSPVNNTNTTDNTPDFNFTVTGDNGSYSAELFINGVGNGTATATNTTATNITANTTLPDGVHTWYINATNVTRLQSEVRTITIDTTPPAITLPVYTNATQHKSSESLTFNISVSDSGVGVDSCVINVATASTGNQTVAVSSGWCNGTYSLSGASEGNQTINAYANDTLNNFGLNNSFVVWIDDTAPTGTLPQYTNATQRRSSDTLILNVSVTDGSGTGADSCNIFVDGQSSNTTITVSSGWCNTSSLSLTGSNEGNSTINVYTNDSVGNWGLNNSFVVWIDDTAPSNLTIVSPTLANNSFTNVNYVEVNFTFTEANPDTCLLEFNNGTAVNYTMTLNLTGNWCFFNATNQSDGAFNYSIYLNDTAGNLASNRTYFVSVDTTTPNITSFTLSSTSVTTGDTITGSCSATDNSESFGGSVTTSITGIDTSSAGSKTATCTATDTAGNSGSTSVSYTVNPRSSSGGGGTPPPPPLPSVSKVFDKIIPGQVAKVTITKEEISFTEIRIEVNNPVNNVKITVTKLEGQPAEITQNITGKVLKYLNIDKTNLDDENIDKLTIDFKVEKTWISDNNIDKSTIALNRFTIQWDKLPTTLVNENEEFVFYTAESPGFSTFAISGIVPSAPETVCGDGLCEFGEDSSSCPEDCPIIEAVCSPGERKCEGNNLLECNAERNAFVTLRTCTYGCDPATVSCKTAPSAPPAHAPVVDNTGLIIGIVVIIIIVAVLIGVFYKKK